MPRFPDDDHFEIPDHVRPDAEVGEKIDKAWSGLRDIEVYLYEKSAETGKQKEELLGKFSLCGDPENEDIPVQPGSEPADSREEVIRWIYAPAIATANEEDRPIHCRARLFYYPTESATRKTVYPKFVAFPDSDPEETEDEVEDDDDDEVPRPLLRPGMPGRPGGLFGRQLGMGLRHPMFGNLQQQEERLREREEKIAEKERQTFGDVMEFIRDRAATLEAREAKVIDVLIAQNESQRAQIDSLVHQQNESNESLYGGRRAEAESRREAQTALVEGIRMQAAMADYRIDVERARADEKIEHIRKDAKRESSGKIVEALLVPVVQNLPQTITSIGGIIQAFRTGGMPPMPAPNMPPPTPQPQYRPEPPTPPRYQHPPPQQQPTNPIATGTPYAGAFITCNEVHASITAEQREMLLHGAGEDGVKRAMQKRDDDGPMSDEQIAMVKNGFTEPVYQAFVGWLTASSDKECLEAMGAFQQIGGAPAYALLDAIMTAEQEKKIVKVADQMRQADPQFFQSDVIDVQGRDGAY